MWAKGDAGPGGKKNIGNMATWPQAGKVSSLGGMEMMYNVINKILTKIFPEVHSAPSQGPRGVTSTYMQKNVAYQQTLARFLITDQVQVLLIRPPDSHHRNPITSFRRFLVGSMKDGEGETSYTKKKE